MKQLKIRKIFYIPILVILITGYIIAGFSSNIEVYHVYKICPAFVVYTDKFLRSGSVGTTKGMIVIIHPNARGYKEILEHELMHIKQGYRCGFLYWIPMLWSDNILTHMEAEAYALHIPDEKSIPFWANMLKEEYKFSASVEELEHYILYYWKEQHNE